MNRQTLFNTLTSALVIFVAALPAAQAGHPWKGNKHNSFYGSAEVLSVEPITRTVHISNPTQECWQEEIHQPVEYRTHRDSAGNTILGGIIGGVIGSQFGGGSGKHAATLAGTLIGASIGHDSAHQSASVTRYDRVSYENRCQTVNNYHTEERVDGYWVTYRYNDETFRTRMRREPGENIRVRVKVSPVYD